MGKGSKPRPIPNRKQFEKNWDKIFMKKDFEFWTHYCKVERTEIGVEKGSPCNWCEMTEHDTIQETKIQKLPIDRK